MKVSLNSIQNLGGGLNPLPETSDRTGEAETSADAIAPISAADANSKSNSGDVQKKVQDGFVRFVDFIKKEANQKKKGKRDSKRERALALYNEQAAFDPEHVKPGDLIKISA
jgi:hypothetical protein